MVRRCTSASTVVVTFRGCGGSIAHAKKMTATPMAAVTSNTFRISASDALT
jgi:hypothetical protein